MESLNVDLVVIGSGPAGQKAAIQGAKLGKKVIVIERSVPCPGGNCLSSGTIPSKTFREAVMILSRFYERGFHSEEMELELIAKVSIKDLKQRLQFVSDEEKNMVLRQLLKNNIQLIHGTAQFENDQKIMVFDDDQRLTYQIRAKVFMIATGSRPRNPVEIPFDKKTIFDSTSLLNIDRIPESMIVLGGGIIGSEYASFFAALGTEVTVVDKRDRILPSIDSEIGVHLLTSLTDVGLKFLGNKQPEEVTRVNDRVHVRCTDGTELDADVLLYALGRTANVDSLGIENAGIVTNEKGYIVVNALFQTNHAHIYAVGDVIGGPSLASTSMEQGRLATLHAFGGMTHYFPDFYPVGIYTIPEISSCGYTEDYLKEVGYRYEIGRAYYYETARGHIAGTNSGMLKILFHSETLEILGVHIIGRNATELVHIGQVAMSFHARIDYFIDQVFNYPTYAECYRVAGLNGFNKIKHLKHT